jgi:hypothetical protein
MAMHYFVVSDYMSATRIALQDLIGPPFRYTDDMIVDALNTAMDEISRIRPDLFLDLKYQTKLKKGDINEGAPGLFSASSETDIVPIPSKYRRPVQWYMEGLLQLTDVTDTQDQRAQAFLAKFQQQLMTLSAA